MSRPLALLCAALIAAALTACSGLAGEPVIVATFPPATSSAPTVEAAAQPSDAPAQTVADQGYPASPPDLANGARLYARHCTACHGVDGAGDGQLVLSGQVGDPGNFRLPDAARSQLPIDWFDTITNGRIEQLMPPWRDALTEQERWDVAMYTYTLHYTPEQIEIGERLFTDCAECHGESGRGDGPAREPGVEVGDLTNQQEMVVLDDEAMGRIVRLGSSEIMPAFGDRFTFEEVWAVVAYARALSLTNAVQVISGELEAQSPSAQPTADAPPTTPTPNTGGAVSPTSEPTPITSALMTLIGAVENRSAGGGVNPDALVTLKVFDAATLAPLPDLDRQTPLNPDNTFAFPNVLVEADKAYLTTTQHAGRDFASGLFQGDPTLEAFALPITVYELTDDPSAVTILAAVSQVRVTGEIIEITQISQLTNTTDRVFTSLTADADGRYPWKVADLPPASVVVGTDDAARYTVAEDGSAVFDTRPLLPGEERFSQVTYLVNYGGGALIEYPLTYALDGQTRLLVTPDTITASGELFPPLGPQQVGEQTFAGYGGPAQLVSGALVRYELTGTAGATITDAGGGVVSSNALLGALAMGAGVVLAVGALVIVLRGRAGVAQNPPARPNNAEIDALIARIAELDALHDAGQLNHDVWHQQRAAHKAQLAALLGESGGASA